MRFGMLSFVLALSAGSLLLPQAAHAAIPFFGPIIPAWTNQCAANWGLLIEVFNNIISLLITLAIVFVAPLMIAYAGFLFVVNPFNSGGINQAKSILTHTVVGIVVAMCGWLLVDAVMAVLYNPASFGSTWSQIVSGNLSEPCIKLAGSLSSGTSFPVGPTTPGVTTSTGTLSSPPSGKAGTACDPSTVQAAAAAGGFNLTNAQANTFACIARPESSCGSNLQNYNWGNGSTAYGAFQVLLQTNASCYENNACYKAAGVSGRLNCDTGFQGGNPIPGSQVVELCKKAASNLDCSASAAACLLQQNGGSFSPWQKDVNSAVQTGCITTGG